MGWDKSTLHAEHIARLLPVNERKNLGVQTAGEAREKATARDEREMQSQIANYLRLHGLWFDCDAMTKRRSGTKGTPDFLLAYKGTPLGLEVKVWGAKPTGDQTACHVAMRANGWHVEIVGGVADVQSVFRYLDQQK